MVTEVDPTPHVVDESYDPDTDLITYTLSNGETFTDEPGDEDWELTEEDRKALLGEAAPPPPPKVKLDPHVIKYVLRHRILTTKMLLDLPEPEWFIERLVPSSPITVLHGAGGARKTFLALDWALCIQHGLDWHGRAIRPGKVLYILGEGVQGLPKRLRAWANAHNMNPHDIAVTWMSEPINLFKLSEDQVANWAAFVKHFKFDYIFVDTLHRCMSGGEENSAKEVGQVFENAVNIAGDAHLIFLHHDPKVGKTQRGSSSIHDDADCVLNISKSGPLTSNLGSDKVRDAEDFSALELTFGEDDDADSIFIKTAGAPTPAITNVDRILNICRAEPFTHTKNAICCMLTDSGAVQRAFKQASDDGWIVSETRANPHKRGPKMVDVWGVDETAVPFMPNGI